MSNNKHHHQQQQGNNQQNQGSRPQTMRPISNTPRNQQTEQQQEGTNGIQVLAEIARKITYGFQYLVDAFRSAGSENAWDSNAQANTEIKLSGTGPGFESSWKDPNGAFASIRMTPGSYSTDLTHQERLEIHNHGAKGKPTNEE